jgi:hypothetical protein
MKRHNIFQTRDVSKESPERIRISMDIILFLEAIVHFHSYAHHKALHTGRKLSRRQDKMDSWKLHFR